MVCPTEAITFPDREMIWKLEREHKIFKLVHKEAKAKKEALAAEKARAEAEEKLSRITSHAQIEVAGEFGEKKFLVQLEDLLRNRPFDIVNLRLEVPTVKGAAEKAPSFMRFEVTSTEQEDIKEFLEEVRTLVRLNHLVLVSEKMM